MTIGEFRALTDDLSDEVEMFIILENVLHSVCSIDSSIMTLRGIDEIEEEVVALSTCRHNTASAKTTLNLN